MNKAITILGFISLALVLSAFSLFSFGVLWETPNGGLIHNLFRITGLSSVVLGSIWTMLFCYREFRS